MESTAQIFLEITLENESTPLAILGESVAGGYENQIGIDSFQFDAKAKKDTLKDLEGGVTANLDIDHVTVSKVFDRSSLLLGGVLNRHQKFKEAKISVDQQYIRGATAGKLRNETLIMWLYDGYVADIKMQTGEGSAGAAIKETVTLSFHNCTIWYYAEDRSKRGDLGSDYRTKLLTFQTEREVQGV